MPSEDDLASKRQKERRGECQKYGNDYPTMDLSIIIALAVPVRVMASIIRSRQYDRNITLPIAPPYYA